MENDSVFGKILETHHLEPAIEINAHEFEKAVLSRRSIRVYDGTPVPETIMRRCLELALLAPNSSNLQPWEFYWVRTPEKRKALVEFCLGQPAASTAAELIVAVGRTDTWKKNSQQMLQYFDAIVKKGGRSVPQAVITYYSKIVHFAYTVGWFSLWSIPRIVLVTVLGWFKPIPREPMDRKDLKLWAAKSSALACENLMLAFRAHGFDTCPMEGLDSHRVKKLLGLPRGAFVVMAISVGKRAKQGVYGPQIRFPSNQFLHEV